MRRILKIAKAELSTMFYSPIAWLILVIFAFQTGLTFVELYDEMVRNQDLGFGGGFMSMGLFSGSQRTIYAVVQNYLYLYMPLLTMGVMSREYSSGTIKLLYSSPVTATQIIIGKYLAIITYGLMLMGILMVYILFSAYTIDNFDMPAILSGLLGIYLLVCAYAAIGLFMSCLTSYQVVAAIGTLAVLAVLNFVNKVGQSYEFIREITYWLSISGRANEMIGGLITSEDILYFVIVITMFLLLSILKLKSTREHSSTTVVYTKYLAVVIGAMVLGYVTSRPKLMFYHDATATKVRTLTPNSQEIMAKLDGGLTITTFVNLLDREYHNAIPSNVMNDMDRFKQYIRFKPEIKMKYVYYYDDVDNNPWLDQRFPGLNTKDKAHELARLRDLNIKMFKTPEQIKEIIDLQPEGNQFVRLVERENGQKIFLRIFNDMAKFPGETEVTAAFKRLVMKLPKVGFLDGHGERRMEGDRARDYMMFSSLKNFRHSLINQGLDVVTLNLTNLNTIPDDIEVVVIADLREDLSDNEKAILDQYIAKGGNLVIAGEPSKRDLMNNFVEQFGVTFLPGILVEPKQDIPTDYVHIVATEAAGEQSYIYKNIFLDRGFYGAMSGASGLAYTEDKGYKVDVVFETMPEGVWNEMETIDFVNDTVRLNTAIGEEERSFPTALSLSRNVGDKEQRIMIFGDADFISNGELAAPKSQRISNFNIITGMFNWLSYGEVPIDVRRPAAIDDHVEFNRDNMIWVKLFLLGLIPLAFIAGGVGLWVRRKRR